MMSQFVCLTDERFSKWSNDWDHQNHCSIGWWQDGILVWFAETLCKLWLISINPMSYSMKPVNYASETVVFAFSSCSNCKSTLQVFGKSTLRVGEETWDAEFQVCWEALQATVYCGMHLVSLLIWWFSMNCFLRCIHILTIFTMAATSSGLGK